MCMITYVPNGVEIPADGIFNGSVRNKDGHGWAVASKAGIVVGKSMNADKALADFVAARNLAPGSAGLFHSRYATHGKYGEFNVHPFRLNRSAVMAHNGILPSQFLPHAGDDRSDTRIFVDRVGRMASETQSGIPSQRMGRTLSRLIGAGNKLVFLSATDKGPRARIINAGAGCPIDGVWYSNTGYMAKKVYTPPQHTNAEIHAEVMRILDEDARRAAIGQGQLIPSHSQSIIPGKSNSVPKSYWTRDEAGEWIRIDYPHIVTESPDERAAREYAEVEAMRQSLEDMRDLPNWADTICPRCGSDSISELAQYCRACRTCVACSEAYDNCACFSPVSEWVTADGVELRV